MSAKKSPDYFNYINTDPINYQVFNDITFPQPLLNEFGKPIEYSVNMLPFHFSHNNYFDEITSLPDECKRYTDIIRNCKNGCPLRDGVYYLTIDESYVNKGSTQRRPGIHTESYSVYQNDNLIYDVMWGGKDGMFIASNISNTTRIFNCRVKPEIIGHLGSLEHISDYLNSKIPSITMERNKLYWMSDYTPHESLPVQETCFRQFYRLVNCDLSHWYSKHSTHNPLCSPPPSTIIVDSNKF